MAEQYDNPSAALEARHKLRAEQWRAMEQEELRRNVEREAHKRTEHELRTRPTQQGEQVAALLRSHRIPTLPMYQIMAARPTEIGQGWHVANIRVFRGVEADASTARFAIAENGSVSEFRSTFIDAANIGQNARRSYQGIIYPMLLESEKAARLIQAPFFQNGVTSLINSCVPYDDPTVYDY